jgi:hypothetical protein
VNESILQIVVTAVNEASEQIESVINSLAGIGEEAASASSSASESLSELGTEAAASASQAVESWDQSLAELQSAMATADASVAEGFGSMAEDAATASTEMESSISSVGGKLQAVGIQLGIMGAAIAAPAVEAIKAAGDQQDAFDQLGNTVANVYASATKPTAGYATEVADLTAKIGAQRASIAEADAAMGKWTGTIAEVGANHEKAAASIATAQVNLSKLEQQLATLTNVQSLAGGSASQTADQFEAAARASTSLGFDVADSATALTYLFSSTNSVTETMSAYQDAMDLSAKLNIPLTQAANDVVQAMNGQGRSLRDLGINVADGLAGQTALDAIQQKVAGSAQLAATQGLGPLNVAQATFNKTMADFGTSVLPMLNTFFEELTKITNAIDQWAQAHPRLAESLLVFLGLVSGILLVLAPLLTLFGFLVIAVEAFNTVMALMGVALEIGIGAALLYIAAFLAFAAIVALVIVYHKQILAAIEYTWNAVIDYVSDKMLALSGYISKGLSDIQNVWQSIWTGLDTFVVNIWTAIGGDVQKGLTYIEGIINGFATTIQNIYKNVMAPITAITSAVSAVGNAAGSVIGGTIKAFASGGIVNSPTLALVGEAGPEAIIPLSAFAGGSSLSGGGIGGFGGGGGGIVINIQGGYYLDQNAAQQIGNALATSIGRQLKLKNFF